jgi:hypothetical protein
MRIYTAILIITGSFFRAHAAEFSYGSMDNSSIEKSNAVVIQGEIQEGDFDRLKQFIRKDFRRFHARMIVLASPGGDLLEAIRIGNLIRSTYQPVFVNSKIGRCASACFLIYVAAVERSAVPSAVGIHRPYFFSTESARLSLSDAEKRQRSLDEQVRKYLEDHEVPRYLIERMFSLSSKEIYWLDVNDLARIGARANWWDQVLVDRCKLNKRLVQGYLDEGESFHSAAKAKQHIHDIAACGYEISGKEGEKNLLKVLRTSP